MLTGRGWAVNPEEGRRAGGHFRHTSVASESGWSARAERSGERAVAAWCGLTVRVPGRSHLVDVCAAVGDHPPE
ncbi:hypothetical protein KTR9_4983 (plasmid) [Gordonia sp. KTR9]|nr:hypothetical protein KTR9_4983 [Gordonia sp. KTR9]